MRKQKFPAISDQEQHSSAYHDTLADIEYKLSFHGTSTSQFNLPTINIPSIPLYVTTEPRCIRDELQYDIMEQQQILDEKVPLLTIKQRAIYDSITEAISNNLPLFAFIDGPGGSGTV